MNYPLLIAPTLRQAEQLRRDLFGHTAAKCRYLADNERIEEQTAGYSGITIFVYDLGNTLYTEHFMEEVLPMLQTTNRVYSVIPCNE